MLPFMVTNVGKDGTFRAYSCFSTMDSFRFEEIVNLEMAHFKKYRSFKCLVRVNCVAKIRKTVILARRANFCPR